MASVQPRLIKQREMLGFWRMSVSSDAMSLKKNCCVAGILSFAYSTTLAFLNSMATASFQLKSAVSASECVARYGMKKIALSPYFPRL